MAFNAVVYSAGNISYDPATGVITFNEAGTYVVRWNASFDGFTTGTTGTTPRPLTFALTSSQGDFLEASTLLSTGQLSSSGIIGVAAAPVTLSLINASADSVKLAATPVSASLVVEQVGSTTPILLQIEEI